MPGRRHESAADMRGRPGRVRADRLALPEERVIRIGVQGPEGRPIDRDGPTSSVGPVKRLRTHGNSGLLAAVRQLLSFEMTAKQYFIYQTVGSIVVNGALNVGFALLERPIRIVPLWGWSGIAFDTMTTTFMLSALTACFGTFFIHRDFESGRFRMLNWTPNDHHVLRLFSYTTILRALVFGPLFTFALVPVTVGVFVLGHVREMAFWDFFAFKVVYAVTLGMIVTPLNALWVLTSPTRAARRTADRARKRCQ